MIFRKYIPQLYILKTLSTVRYYSKIKNPFSRTWNILSKDMPKFLGAKKDELFYPEHADVVIIGGGFVGSFVAYWLKSRAGEGLSVAIIEKDFTFKNARNIASLGTITQHFSLPENILMAKFGAEFLRNIRDHVNNDVDIEYLPTGSLVLASEKYADRLDQNIAIQREYGVRNELLTVDDINKRYPYISCSDIKLGCMGNESEGIFNAWDLLKAIIFKNRELGVLYVNAEVDKFELQKQKDVLMEGITPGSFERITHVIYRTIDGEEHSLKFAACVLAAGVQSAEVAKLAKIGTGDGLLQVPLPIQSRTSSIYSMEENAVGMNVNTPMIMDTSGIWLKRRGLAGDILCGHAPLLTGDSKYLSDSEFYKDVIKPSLTNRIPCAKDVEMKKYVTEVNDCNPYDETGILGPHPYHHNLYIAGGFGNLGCQNAPAIGRAIAELIIDSQFTTIDLTRFSFDRLLTDSPMIETNVY